MNKPIISICIPTFNGEATLSETIDSILKQDVNLELIISDGGSSDNTLEIVGSMTDHRLKLFRTSEKLSPQDNWNRAARLGSTPFLKIMGQDDVLLPGALEKELHALSSEEGSGVAFVYSKPALLAGDSLSHRGRDRVHTSCIVSSEQLVRKIVRSGRNPIGEPVAVTMRRNIFEKCVGFRGRYVIDLDLYVQLLEHGPALKIPGPLTAFRISRGSWSSQLLRVQAQETKELHRRLSSNTRWNLRKSDRIIGGLLASVYPFGRFVVTRVLTK